MHKPTIPADVQLHREYLQSISAADLTPDLRDLAEVIGIDAVRLILSTFGGETLHIPTPRSFRGVMGVFIRTQLQENDSRAMERQLAAAAAQDAARVSARDTARSQQADIIREMIPAAEVQVLFDRYITQEEIA